MPPPTATMTGQAAAAPAAVASNDVDAHSALQGELPGIFGSSAPTVIAAVIVLSIGSDLVLALVEDASTLHTIGSAIGTVCSIVALVLMWRLMRAIRAQARALTLALESTRLDLVQWRAKASTTLHGLGALIDRQFAGWGLSSAESEVGLLLLKGLALKAIAEVRETSERTVRQQALAIYRKAGVAGRAELSAFFLEDLLLPGDQRDLPLQAERPTGSLRG